MVEVGEEGGRWVSFRFRAGRAMTLEMKKKKKCFDVSLMLLGPEWRAQRYSRRVFKERTRGRTKQEREADILVSSTSPSSSLPLLLLLSSILVAPFPLDLQVNSPKVKSKLDRIKSTTSSPATKSPTDPTTSLTTPRSCSCSSQCSAVLLLPHPDPSNSSCNY